MVLLHSDWLYGLVPNDATAGMHQKSRNIKQTFRPAQPTITASPWKSIDISLQLQRFSFLYIKHTFVLHVKLVIRYCKTRETSAVSEMHQ